MSARNIIIALIFACTFICYLERQGFAVAFTALAKEKELSEATKGAVMSAFFYGYAVMQVPGGYLSAKYGGKLVLTLSFALWTAVSFLTPGGGYGDEDESAGVLLLGALLSFGGGPSSAARNAALLDAETLAAAARQKSLVRVLLLCRVLVGAAQGMFIPAAHTVLAKWVPPYARSRLVSLAMSGMYLGSALAMAAVPPLVAAAGPAAQFRVVGCVGAAWLLGWLWWGADKPLSGGGSGGGGGGSGGYMGVAGSGGSGGCAELGGGGSGGGRVQELVRINSLKGVKGAHFDVESGSNGSGGGSGGVLLKSAETTAATAKGTLSPTPILIASSSDNSGGPLSATTGNGTTITKRMATAAGGSHSHMSSHTPRSQTTWQNNAVAAANHNNLGSLPSPRGAMNTGGGGGGSDNDGSGSPVSSSEGSVSMSMRLLSGSGASGGGTAASHPHAAGDRGGREAEIGASEAAQRERRAAVIPWRRLLSSKAVLAILGSNFAFHCGVYVVMNWTPTYFETFLGTDLLLLGSLKILPYLAMFVFSNLGGALGDWLIYARGMSTRSSRKAVNALGLTCAAVSLVGMATARGWAGGVVWLTATLSSLGLSRGGWSVNHMDIAPRHAGVVMAIANGAGTLAGVVGVWLTGVLLERAGEDMATGWLSAFGFVAAVCVAAAAFFAACAQGEVLFP